MTDISQISRLLNEIEHELRQLELWRSAPPSPEALASTEPFCVDTLSLSEWLQWILIPRMRALIEGQLPLPGNCAIHAIAVESFKDPSLDCSALLALIEALDTALSEA